MTNEIVDRIKFPTRYRKRRVHCILCDEPTMQNNAICENCNEFYEQGKRTKAAQASGEKSVYWFKTNASIGDSFKVQIYLSELLSILTTEPTIVHPYTGGESPEKAFLEERYLTDLSVKQNGEPNLDGKGGFNSISYSAILLTKEQGEIVKKFWQILKDTLIQEKLNGERSGSHFLLKMASGNLSIDQINEWHNKQEK